MVIAQHISCAETRPADPSHPLSLSLSLSLFRMRTRAYAHPFRPAVNIMIYLVGQNVDAYATMANQVDHLAALSGGQEQFAALRGHLFEAATGKLRAANPGQLLNQKSCASLWSMLTLNAAVGINIAEEGPRWLALLSHNAAIVRDDVYAVLLDGDACGTMVQFKRKRGSILQHVAAAALEVLVSPATRGAPAGCTISRAGVVVSPDLIRLVCRLFGKNHKFYPDHATLTRIVQQSAANPFVVGTSDGAEQEQGHVQQQPLLLELQAHAWRALGDTAPDETFLQTLVSSLQDESPPARKGAAAALRVLGGSVMVDKETRPTTALVQTYRVLHAPLCSYLTSLASVAVAVAVTVDVTLPEMICDGLHSVGLRRAHHRGPVACKQPAAVPCSMGLAQNSINCVLPMVQ